MVKLAGGFVGGLVLLVLDLQLVRLLLVLVLVLGVDLAPHLPHLLCDVSDLEVGVLLPDLGPLVAHKEEVGGHRPLGGVRVFLRGHRGGCVKLVVS